MSARPTPYGYVECPHCHVLHQPGLTHFCPPHLLRPGAIAVIAGITQSMHTPDALPETWRECPQCHCHSNPIRKTCVHCGKPLDGAQDRAGGDSRTVCPPAKATGRKSRKKPTTPRSRVKNALRLVWLRSRERAACLKAAGNCCARCGVKASVAKGREVKMEVHHRDGIDWNGIVDGIFAAMLPDPARLEAVCKACHSKEHEAIERAQP